MPALRDMTRTQFAAALKRNGFNSPVLYWVSHRDLPSISFGMTVSRAGKLMRRETIANLIRRRDQELAKREAAHAR